MLMNISQGVSLVNYSTMRLGGQAAYLSEVQSRDDVVQAVQWAKTNNVPIRMIGRGSNIVWQDSGFPGLLLINKIKNYEPFAEDPENYYVTIGAGEIWDATVERSVAAGATGIEALSLIPGTVGAAPVQNIGAYGQDISQTLVSVEAYDCQTNVFVNIPNTDCGFGYRTSRFKTTDKGRFLITGITLHLMIANPRPPFYPAVENYFKEHGVQDFTPASVRKAVIEIRSSKLPDPEKVANNGSFFVNPIVDQGLLRQIVSDYQDVVFWPVDNDRVKLSAAWLVEKAGFKDFHDPETGMGTWPKQALVLVNEQAKSTNDLLKFKQKIVEAVESKFNVKLEQEPELLP